MHRTEKAAKSLKVFEKKRGVPYNPAFSTVVSCVNNHTVVKNKRETA
jgi:hypothetical protein